MINKYISFFYTTLSDNLKNDKCSICLESSCDYILPCNHIYHETCIIKWIERQNKITCPLCRKEYKNLILKKKLN